jgi:hypothetical protein
VRNTAIRAILYAEANSILTKLVMRLGHKVSTPRPTNRDLEDNLGQVFM